MTLFAKLAVTKETIVFTGDKRVSDAKGFADTYVKATPLGTRAVGGVTGHTRVINRETGEALRDTHEDLRTFFKDREANTGTIDEFRQYLRDQYQAYLDRHQGGKEQDDVDCILFTTAMTFHEHDRQLDCKIRAHVTTKGGLVASKNNYVCTRSNLILFGDPEIVDAVRFLQHPSLKEIYKHSDIVALLKGPQYCDYGMITVERAIEICRLVIRVCSQKAHEITGKASTISENCDVLLLDKDGVHSV
jgi:hypothetical protein